MDAGSAAQIASAVFTAGTATIALFAIRQAKQQTLTAREALESQTQPLLTDVPHGRLREPQRLNAGASQQMKWQDAGEIDIGTSGAEPLCSASVPIRNVGNGTARIDAITFKTHDGEAPGEATSPVIPPGEIGRVSLHCLPNDADSLAAESIAIEFRDFSILIDYSDASGRSRGSLLLEIANGQHPHVRGRTWDQDRIALSTHRVDAS